MKEKDEIAIIMEEIEAEFLNKFNTAFGMKREKDHKVEKTENK